MLTTPTLIPRSFTQVISDHFGITDHRALSEDDVLCILHSVTHHTFVFATGQRCILRHGLVGQIRNVIKIERTLGGDALCIGFLVLYRTQHGREIEVIQLGYATALLAKHGPLCTGG